MLARFPPSLVSLITLVVAVSIKCDVVSSKSMVQHRSSLKGDFLQLWSAPIYVSTIDAIEAVTRLDEGGLAAQYASLVGFSVPRTNSMDGWTIQGMEIEGCLTSRSREINDSDSALFLATSVETKTTLSFEDPRGGSRKPFDQDFTYVLEPGQLVLYPTWLRVTSVSSTRCHMDRIKQYLVRHSACNSGCGSLNDLWSMHPHDNLVGLMAGIGPQMRLRELVLREPGTLHEVYGSNIYIEPQLQEAEVTSDDLEVTLKLFLTTLQPCIDHARAF